jgi:hypothetical protein
MSQYPDPDVTVIVVYQDSMPWLSVLLESFKHFKNDAKIRHIFVENLPQRDSASKYVDEFLEGLDMHCWKHTKMSTYPPPCADGRAHAHGLRLAYPAVTTEWCMFMDADAGPMCDNWMDKMLSMKDKDGRQADMVGFVPDSGIENYSLPVLHPCMLLFRTKLARPPYWTKELSKMDENMYFGSWAHGDTPDGAQQYDCCRPFTYTIGMNPECVQVKLDNQYSHATDGTPYFRLCDNDGNVLGYHIREGSKRWARGNPGTNAARWNLTKAIPELSWFNKEVKIDEC